LKLNNYCLWHKRNFKNEQLEYYYKLRDAKINNMQKGMIGFTNVIRMMFAKDDPSKHPPTDLHTNTHKKIDVSK
jgi:hypothetical protein